MPEPAQSLLISACLGALIGLIRQWEAQRGDETASEFAGLRTFTIVAMLGCISAFIANSHSPGAFAVALGVLGLLLVVVQWALPVDQQAGYTTPGAVLITFFCGALVFWQERQVAILSAAVTMLLLGLKQPIHQWTRRFTIADVRSVLQFVAITGLILPLVPNRGFGPYQAFNPWSTWLMVVLISGLGFLGYLLVRLLGSNSGIALSGIVGGLASSTATTLAFSRRSREDPGLSASYALAVVLACNVMLGRVLVVVSTLRPEFARMLFLPFLIMAVPGLAFAAWRWLGGRQSKEHVNAPSLSNPLSVRMAMKFAFLYALVTLLVKALTQSNHTQGVLVISAVAGLTDVDAITLSMVEAVGTHAIDARLAVTAVVIGCISNTLAKAGIAAALGSPALRRLILAVLGSTAAAGVLALGLMRAL